VSIFLQEPEYLLGCFGFIVARSLRRGVVYFGAVLSALAAVLALALLVFHRSTPMLIGQMLFLEVCAWVFVFALFRLFWSGMMWLFDQIGDVFANAVPGLRTPIHYPLLP
jgi:hypothetical protein